jgi:hypothetical protein
MASGKKSKAKPAATAKKTGAEPSWLRSPSDRRTERRFQPSSNSAALFGMIVSCIGAVGVGAGVFGQFVRKAGPHPWALYLMVAGSMLFFLGFILGSRAVLPLRVGDAGLAAERGGTIERLAWFDVDVVRFASGALTFTGFGRLITIPVAAHPDAAWLALAEARARIPAKVASIKDDLPKMAKNAGELILLEEPQMAGLRCKASDRLITFEGDARLCGRCGQSYHREEVPKHCKTCDAKL